MIYSYKCECGKKETRDIKIDERNNQHCECGKLLKRIFSSPETNRLIGLDKASKKDRVGYMIDFCGNICEPKTRGKG